MQMRPMLAAKFEDRELENLGLGLAHIRFPVLASPKIDGIRTLIDGGRAMSRSWKPLPNTSLQAFVSEYASFLNYLDGEIILGSDPTVAGLFNKTQSAVMTQSGDLDFTLYVFDYYRMPEYRFFMRNQLASKLAENMVHPRVKFLEHSLLNSPEEVMVYEEEALAAGYEGIMIRSPEAPYKFGRSTLREQGLIKIKRFEDDEAIVVGFEALERNTNTPTLDAFGLQKRSSHKAGKVTDNLLGKLVVQTPRWGTFAIGSGFDMAMREEIWLNQDKYLGKIVSFKFQAHGTKDKPRAPIFKGFRSELD